MVFGVGKGCGIKVGFYDGCFVDGDVVEEGEEGGEAVALALVGGRGDHEFDFAGEFSGGRAFL